MGTLTAQEARSLSGIARQVRALLAGIDKLPEAFSEVEAMEVRIAEAKQEKLTVEADIAALRADFTKLDGEYRSLQQRYDGLRDEYKAKREELEASCCTLQADVEAAKQLKQETENHLAALKAKL